MAGHASRVRIVAAQIVFLLLSLLLVGCRGRGGSPPPVASTRPSLAFESAPADGGLESSRNFEPLEAIVAPPADWAVRDGPADKGQAHRVWLSPSGRTAFGVIRVNLPLPFLSPRLLLGPFLKKMREAEGEGRLISRASDPNLPGLRFVAEGGRYTMRGNLISRGWRAWVVYAGILRSQPVAPDELDVAERAREAVRPGATK